MIHPWLLIVVSSWQGVAAAAARAARTSAAREPMGVGVNRGEETMAEEMREGHCLLLPPLRPETPIYPSDERRLQAEERRRG